MFSLGRMGNITLVVQIGLIRYLDRLVEMSIGNSGHINNK